MQFSLPEPTRIVETCKWARSRLESTGQHGSHRHQVVRQVVLRGGRGQGEQGGQNLFRPDPAARALLRPAPLLGRSTTLLLRTTSPSSLSSPSLCPTQLADTRRSASERLSAPLLRGQPLLQAPGLSVLPARYEHISTAPDHACEKSCLNCGVQAHMLPHAAWPQQWQEAACGRASLLLCCC